MVRIVSQHQGSTNEQSSKAWMCEDLMCDHTYLSLDIITAVPSQQFWQPHLGEQLNGAKIL